MLKWVSEMKETCQILKNAVVELSFWLPALVELLHAQHVNRPIRTYLHGLTHLVIVLQALPVRIVRLCAARTHFLDQVCSTPRNPSALFQTVRRVRRLLFA